MEPPRVLAAAVATFLAAGVVGAAGAACPQPGDLRDARLAAIDRFLNLSVWIGYHHDTKDQWKGNMTALLTENASQSVEQTGVFAPRDHVMEYNRLWNPVFGGGGMVWKARHVLPHTLAYSESQSSASFSTYDAVEFRQFAARPQGGGPPQTTVGTTYTTLTDNSSTHTVHFMPCSAAIHTHLHRLPRPVAAATSGGFPAPDAADFCASVAATCPGDAFPYDSPQHCQDFVGALPQSCAGQALQGNTTSCRVLHLANAADDAAKHCPHIGPASFLPGCSGEAPKCGQGACATSYTFVNATDTPAPPTPANCYALIAGFATCQTDPRGPDCCAGFQGFDAAGCFCDAVAMSELPGSVARMRSLGPVCGVNTRRCGDDGSDPDAATLAVMQYVTIAWVVLSAASIAAAIWCGCKRNGQAKAQLKGAGPGPESAGPSSEIMRLMSETSAASTKVQEEASAVSSNWRKAKVGVFQQLGFEPDVYNVSRLLLASVQKRAESLASLTAMTESDEAESRRKSVYFGVGVAAREENDGMQLPARDWAPSIVGVDGEFVVDGGPTAETVSPVARVRSTAVPGFGEVDVFEGFDDGGAPSTVERETTGEFPAGAGANDLLGFDDGAPARATVKFSGAGEGDASVPANPYASRSTVVGADTTRHFGIRFGDLRLSVRGRQIVGPLTGQFLPGTLNYVAGSSGAGKSCLIKMLAQRPRGNIEAAGLLQFGFDGEVHVADSQPPAAWLRGVAYLAQDDVLGGLPYQLTCREVLAVYMQLHHPHTAAAGGPINFRSIDHVVEAMGLETCADTDVTRISGGQMKRLLVGTRLFGNPRAIILDEPTSGLDATASLQLMATLHALSRLGLLIVVTIHQPRAEIIDLCDQVFFMATGGKQMFAGPPGLIPEVYTKAVGVQFEKGWNEFDTLQDVAGKERIRDALVRRQQALSLPLAASFDPDIKPSFGGGADGGGCSRWDPRGWVPSLWVPSIFLALIVGGNISPRPAAERVGQVLFNFHSGFVQVAIGGLLCSFFHGVLPLGSSDDVSELSGASMLHTTFSLFIFMMSLAMVVLTPQNPWLEQLTKDGLSHQSDRTWIVVGHTFICTFFTAWLDYAIFHFSVGFKAGDFLEQLIVYFLFVFEQASFANVCVLTLGVAVGPAIAGMSIALRMITCGLLMTSSQTPVWWQWLNPINTQKKALAFSYNLELAGASAACADPSVAARCCPTGDQLLELIEYDQVSGASSIAVLLGWIVLEILVYWAYCNWGTQAISPVEPAGPAAVVVPLDAADHHPDLEHGTDQGSAEPEHGGLRSRNVGSTISI